ncbi:hypothetical protein ACVDG3_13445 [Meridianimarinicoccus sp. RP-17]|uniref:hypothetical protein n=1 Tax=Meridianimarinicoccus zhengii TaxID=2056810 RepID=UPI000DAC8604|nr:hypothetical protein [Phycocomes zhengii]
MRRRSWKDLDRPAAPAPPGAPRAVAGTAHAPGPGDLAQAAALAPDSRLNSLLAERRALEDRLRNLTGLPGQQGSGDPHRDARFHVPSFAERQAQIRAWEAQRQARAGQAARDAQGRWGSRIGARPTSGQGADLPDPALPGPASGLGASGLGTDFADRTAALRDRIAGRSRRTRESLLDRPRAATAQVDAIGRPLRNIGDQLSDQTRQLDEMDRKLAAEGVSEAERDEIRRAVKGDEIKKVSGIIDRANTALSAPKKAVERIDRAWAARERQIAGPMDQVSSYAATRDRRLSTDTGGSGDLFERMQANRLSALRRRQTAQMQDRRDERRRERARERAAERRDADA